MNEHRLGSRIREIRSTDRECPVCHVPLKFIGEDFPSARFKWHCVNCGVNYLVTAYNAWLPHRVKETELPKIIQLSKGERRDEAT